MYWLEAAIAAVGIISPVAALPSLQQRVLYTPNATRADAVKAAFQTAWDGYYKYAFPNDSLKPISNTGSNDR